MVCEIIDIILQMLAVGCIKATITQMSLFTLRNHYLSNKAVCRNDCIGFRLDVTLILRRWDNPMSVLRLADNEPFVHHPDISEYRAVME